MARHTWTEDDEILALELYFRRLELSATNPDVLRLREIIESRGIPSSSIAMKLSNIEYLDSNGSSGLENASQLNRVTWKELGHDRSKLSDAAQSILDKSS